MKKQYIVLLICLLTSFYGNTQVCISSDGSPADSTAMLDIKSNSRGLLIPRMTVMEIQLIASPANGLLVYCLSDANMYSFSSVDNKWKALEYGVNTLIPNKSGKDSGGNNLISDPDKVLIEKILDKGDITPENGSSGN